MTSHGRAETLTVDADLDVDRCLTVDEGVECGDSLDDGEGYDGECGRHATLRYLEDSDLDEDGL